MQRLVLNEKSLWQSQQHLSQTTSNGEVGSTLKATQPCNKGCGKCGGGGAKTSLLATASPAKDAPPQVVGGDKNVLGNLLESLSSKAAALPGGAGEAPPGEESMPMFVLTCFLSFGYFTFG